MATNRSYTVIGLFLLGAVVLAVVAVLVLGGNRIFTNSRQAIIFFDQSVLGLSQGSKVLFRGVQIGTVKNVQLRLDPTAGKSRIGVTIEVGSDNTVMMDGESVSSDVSTKDLVKRGLRAQLVVWSYVTSQLAVNLDFRPDTKPEFVIDPVRLDQPEIPAVPSQIEQIKDTVTGLPWQETLTNVNDTMTAMVTLARDIDDLVGKMGPQLADTSNTANKTMAAARRTIEVSNTQIEKTLTSFRKLSSSLNDQVAKRDEQIDHLLDNAEHTSRNLAQLSENLKDFTDPGSDSRQDIQSAIRDLTAGASSLRRFAETLERDPNALLLGGGR